MEILRGGGDVADLHVLLGAELKKTLESGAGVLGSLSLVAMGKEHDERTGTQPLGLRGADELVDDDLGAVGKVAELGLPHAEHLGIIHRIAVVEAEHGGLGEGAVVDAEAGLVGSKVLQRDVALAGLLVVEDGVAVAEGAAATVLSGEADRDSLDHERPEGKRLAVGPVISGTLLENLAAALQHGLAELGQDPEIGGNRGEPIDDGLQGLLTDGGLDGLERVIGLEDGGRSDKGLLVGLHVGDDPFLHLREGGLEMPLGLLPAGVEVLLREGAERLGALEEDLAGTLVGADDLVEVGLGEERLVTLVVPVAAVADDVDDDIATKFLAVGDGDAGSLRHGDRVVAVDVENRGLDGLGYLGAIKGRTRVLRQGGEADLVVDDKVDRATHFVAVEVAEVEALRDDSLAREGGVAVDQDRDDLFAVHRVTQDALAGPHLAEDDGIHRLEVAGVGGKVDLGLLAPFVVPGSLIAEVVLHVPAGLAEIRIVFVAELVENDGERLLEEIREDVQASAVGHAEHQFLHPEFGGTVEDLGKCDHHRLTALKREALAADVGGVDEVLEALCLVKGSQDPVVGSGGVGWADAVLHAVAHPVADDRVLNVHVLDPEGVAVDRLQLRDDLAELHRLPVPERAGGDDRIEIGVGESEFLQLKKGLKRLLLAEGIKLRDGVTERTVRVNQRLDPALDRAFAGRSSLGGGA